MNRHLCAILLALAPVWGAPAPKLLREIDLNRIMQGQAASAYHAKVFTIAISPDEKWVAVALRSEQAANPRQVLDDTRVILLPLLGPTDHPVQIVTPNLALARWSPASDSLLVETAPFPGPSVIRMYGINGDELWQHQFPGKASPSGFILGFLAPKLLLVNHPGENRKSTTLDTIGFNGQVIENWEPKKMLSTVATNTDRDLVAIAETGQKTRIVDFASKKVIRTVAFPSPHPMLIPQEVFADSGKAICAAAPRMVTECRSTDTGARIGRYHGPLGDEPIGASPHASRLVVNPLTILNGPRTYDERIVWDFREGKEIASWHPLSQQMPPPRAGLRPIFLASFDISATGRYEVEGADGRLRIFELP